eukprot:683155-Pyramimonas_sp.AAC.1
MMGAWGYTTSTRPDAPSRRPTPLKGTKRRSPMARIARQQSSVEGVDRNWKRSFKLAGDRSGRTRTMPPMKATRRNFGREGISSTKEEEEEKEEGYSQEQSQSLCNPTLVRFRHTESGILRAKH